MSTVLSTQSFAPLAFSGTSHDHRQCVTQALAQATQICQQRDARLTPLRRRVLELIWRSHKPLGAYTILESLHVDEGRRAAPPTVYRALEFLIQQGLIHRIASLNAFIGCIHPDKPHVGQFLICTECGNAAELETPLIADGIALQARTLGFIIENQVIEITGRCASCQQHHKTS
ncbi:Fe2+/Zn2+ uptake regulation protein [Beggiatoa alba B18LD]|uniref:Fe2+/Zn2+ uptake regulation protein n=1 Tax=Beggiatoa alba B18LD TaxID=395493 RepID=I3CEB5_9GAMM|nr:Fur family transcriptional regulator [Beggiatoa alba]EIJ41958.1 Fe2+/Zn2+ uptake regulation protein [Beggiatoa alba B18LD]